MRRSGRGVAVLTAAALIALAPASSAEAACGWRTVPVPNSGIYSVLVGVDARTPGDAWAVGQSVVRGKVSGELMARPFILHWNGTSWKVIKAAHLAGTKNEFLLGVAMVSKDDVWVVGGYQSATPGGPDGSEIQHWDGVKWSIVPSPTVGTGSTLTHVDSISANDIWAVGKSAAGATEQALIEHWNGTRWRVTTHPFTASNTRLTDVARIPGTTRAWTVGSVSSTTLTGRSTGTTWAAVPSPNVDAFPNSLGGVSATSATDAWAVGSYKDGVDHSLVERWNGTDWSVEPSPDVGTEGTTLVAVGASSPTRALAVGQRVKGPLDRIIAERWNGSEWKVISFPNVGVGSNDVTDLATIPGTNSAWAVGLYIDLDSARPLAERYC